MLTPSEVKAAVTGNGRADKRQVQTMVQRILGLAEPPRPADAADALAVAVAHAWSSGPRGKRDRAQHGGDGTWLCAGGRDCTLAEGVWLGAERISRRRGAVAPGGGRGV